MTSGKARGNASAYGISRSRKKFLTLANIPKLIILFGKMNALPEHSHCRTQETKDKLVARLRRIEGQTRALQQMISDDRECVEILRLVNSVSGALRGVWTEVLSDHLKGCIRESLEHKDAHLLEELAELLKKSR